MATTINFAIDLGTTNSLIAKGGAGNVDFFRNPAGMRMTLPSVVAFRKDRILIGDKAREYIEKDPANVFAAFKRKMGTSETFFESNSGTFKTPIELSAIILRELRSFIFTGESPESVVITIPASFDTIQSNATKEAGHLAGFREVLLLQEPIAASLAFANKEGKSELKGQWLVYDLGGGTFDVALVKFEDDEMKVIDHEGDNFFGGVDFDNLILAKTIIPYLEKKYGIDDLSGKMRNVGGQYIKLYYQLLYKAEEAKIALSAHPSAEIEFDFSDETTGTHEEFFTLTRPQFDEIIRERIMASISFIRVLLERNRLAPEAINEVVLVGGSTYIPLVRELLQEELRLPVNTSIDPTTAVVEGAAYYAGSKVSRLEQPTGVTGPVAAKKGATKKGAAPVTVKMAYARNSREPEEYFAAAIHNAPLRCNYRIVRAGGGFDSGLKPVAERISEVLVLLPNTLNVFHLRLYDEAGAPLEAGIPEISIVQGKYSIHGQPLPHDICLEVDDTLNKITHLEVIFERNAILPLKKTITKTLSRTIVKGSDDQLRINILEGSRYSSPQANLPIGIISISAKDLGADLVKGCDIDLSFEISESRDFTVAAYISMIETEYKQAFSPSSRAVNLARLKEEVGFLHRTATTRLSKLLANERYEESTFLQLAILDLEAMQQQLRALGPKDVTDSKFQLDDQKRRLAVTIEAAAKDDMCLLLKEEYFEKKEYYRELLATSGDPVLLRRFEALSAEEGEWVTNCSTQFLRVKIKEMDRLVWNIRRRDIHYVTALYIAYAIKPNEAYSNQREIKTLRERGDEALNRKNVDEIMSIINRMYDLLVDKNNDEEIKGTGLRG